MRGPGWKHAASLLVLALMLILAYGSSSSSNSSSRSRSSSSSPRSAAPSGEKRIDGDNWFGCQSRDYFEKIVGFAAQRDNEAFSKALAAGILQGNCIRFTARETVFLEDTAIFSGLVKVRRKGETSEYWTNLEAVD